MVEPQVYTEQQVQAAVAKLDGWDCAMAASESSTRSARSCARSPS
jgi:hypothetical protein